MIDLKVRIRESFNKKVLQKFSRFRNIIYTSTLQNGYIYNKITNKLENRTISYPKKRSGWLARSLLRFHVSNIKKKLIGNSTLGKVYAYQFELTTFFMPVTVEGKYNFLGKSLSNISNPNFDYGEYLNQTRFKGYKSRLYSNIKRESNELVKRYWK